jgi:hypothetical protein
MSNANAYEAKRKQKQGRKVMKGKTIGHDRKIGKRVN